MNSRERYLATAGFRPVDRVFLIPPWPWGETVERWRREGLPGNVNLAEHFTTDLRQDCAPIMFHNQYGTPLLVPPLERKIISEGDGCQIISDECGNIVKVFKDNPGQSMPEWIEYPVKNREDWESVVKPRLDWRSPERVPRGEDLRKYAESVRDRDYPLGVWAASFYGWPRCLTGVERISMMLYDEPDLVHEMCEHIGEYAVNLLSPLLEAVQFDFAYIWEDMAGKSGPLCSPAMYREFCFGPLKLVTELLRRHGVKIIIIDSDGNNDVLIPVWLEAGVTGLRPFEAAAGCDAVAARRLYGKDLIIEGAIDKRALAKGKEAIEQELLSKVPWLCMQGGYFPQVDHLVPPDVPLENYMYYAELLCSIADDPERHLHEAKKKGFWKYG